MAVPQDSVTTLLSFTVPLGCNPLRDPAAASSTVPVGEGESENLPTTFTSPENAVARSVPGSKADTVANGATLVSLILIHGW